MPWGGDNLLPYYVLDMIESDETLSTCQIFNAEVCYGNGLQYNTEACTKQVKDRVIGTGTSVHSSGSMILSL